MNKYSTYFKKCVKSLNFCISLICILKNCLFCQLIFKFLVSFKFKQRDYLDFKDNHFGVVRIHFYITECNFSIQKLTMNAQGQCLFLFPFILMLLWVLSLRNLHFTSFDFIMAFSILGTILFSSFVYWFLVLEQTCLIISSWFKRAIY